MKRQHKNDTLHQKLMRLIWMDITIFFLIAGSGAVLSHRIYRQSMEKETSNVFEASFSNIENTLHFVENIAFHIMNDKTVKEALRAVNQQRDDRYPLVDELYYRIITGSLVANDAISIIVTDQMNQQYGTGSLTENLTEEEQRKIQELFRERSSQSDPIWFSRESSGELVYGREIYDTPFGGYSCLGRILIRVDLDKMKAEGKGGSLEQGNIILLYRGKPVYASDKHIFEQAEFLDQVKRDQKYFMVDGKSGFQDVSYIGYVRSAELTTSANTLIIFFTLAILLVLILSFLVTAQVVHQITAPVKYLGGQMKTVEKGDFSVQISMDALGTDIQEMKELAVRFNLMTAEINRLVQDSYLRTIKEKEYQLKALQAQINPHFLYNALDTINWLAVDSGRPEISSMVQALATIFRETTNQKQYMISLREELALLSCYVTIQKIRLEERLEVHFSIPEQCMELEIPKLSLQPILENSVKYAAEASMKPCQVQIHARKRNGSLILCIWDNGPGIPPQIRQRIRTRESTSSTGIGLINIEERVRMLGGIGSGMKIYASPKRGTWIRLTIVQTGGDEA
ncbi:MAG: sensor histidine kinase [Lachnospiraceae bacterium]|nr:sensor histidine kinase [Lachnospiraceae bacterium]